MGRLEDENKVQRGINEIWSVSIINNEECSTRCGLYGVLCMHGVRYVCTGVVWCGVVFGGWGAECDHTQPNKKRRDL